MRKKHERASAFPHLPNCEIEPLDKQGTWRQRFPNAQQPLWLELAAGKAYFTAHLAAQRPHINHIAIDTKRDRLFMGASQALEQGTPNAYFLWMDIYILDRVFAPAEVDGLWITFPDPYPKDRHAARRLTSPYFLELYRKVVKPGAPLHFKTDDPPLFNYSLETLAAANISVEVVTNDLYESELLDEMTGIPTPFETRWRKEGKPINYLRARY